MTRALLVLGAGPLELPALRWAREAGLATVVTDPDPRAPGRRLAREFQPLAPCDVDGHRALVRCWQRAGTLVGALATTRRGVRLQAALSSVLGDVSPTARALETALDEEAAREQWRAAGLPTSAPRPEDAGLEVTAFFRDGHDVPCGITERSGDESAVQPGLEPARAAEAHALARRAADVLGVAVGLVQVTLVPTPSGLAVARLFPGIADLVGATEVAPLAYGKSPLQAWFASLADAGGPFDSFPTRARAHAGWIALRAAQAGRLQGLAGLDRARRMPGVVDLCVDRPGRDVPRPGAACGFAWAVAEDRTELEHRLRRARAALEVRVECKQVA